MNIKVPYMEEAEIERESDLLLAEYADTTGRPIKLPVPVDEITRYHLALRLGLADLHQTLGIPMLRDQPDILGAIWMEAETILIDDSLNPKKFPSMAGRYRFSVAHEIGHWRLHRPYVSKDSGQAGLFGRPTEPTIICRAGRAKESIEWQADGFASCLLMPRRQVNAAWQDRMGRTRPLLVGDLRPNDRVMMRAQRRIYDQGRDERGAVDDALLEEVGKPLARRFGVSAPAMRIRLEKLGLLLRQPPAQGNLGLDQ